MPQVGQRLQNELPKRPAQRLLAAPQMVVLPPVRQRLAEAAQLRAVRGEPRDELMPVHLQVPQASQLLACLLALEPVPSEPPSEPRARSIPARCRSAGKAPTAPCVRRSRSTSRHLAG